jgi:hypothetical protein
VRAAYTGNEALTFSQYADAETGKTLHAEPGGVYEVLPASGHAVPEIPEAWFVPVDDPVPDLWSSGPETEAAPEPGTQQDPPEPSEF